MVQYLPATQSSRSSIEPMSKRVVIFVLLGVAVILFLLIPRNDIARRQAVAMRGQTRFRIGALQMWLFRAAGVYPEVFSRVMPTNVALEATSLPKDVIATFLEGDKSECLTDAWGRPFHLIMTLKPGAEQTNGYPCELFIWSDGPNAVNENGKGDDITNTTTNRSTN